MDNAITIKDLFRIITETDFSNNSSLSAEELDKIANEYVSRKKKIDTQTAEANEAYKQGRYNEALAKYTEVISLIRESNKYVNMIGNFLKKKQEEEAGKSSAFYPAKLYASFYEATCEVLDTEAKALATTHTMRGIVNRDLGNLNDAINDYKEGLKHSSVREMAQNNIIRVQEMLAGKRPAKEYTMQEIREQAEQGKRFLKMMDDAKKRVEQKEAQKPENLQAELEKYKTLLAQKDSAVKRSKKRWLVSFGLASLALAAASIFGGYTLKNANNYSVYELPHNGWDHRGKDHVDEKKDEYYFVYWDGNSPLGKKIYFQGNAARFKYYPELIRKLQEEYAQEIGDRGFTAYETFQILTKIDMPEGGDDVITAGEIKAALKNTETPAQIRSTFDLKLEPSLGIEETFNELLKKK